MQPAQRLSQNGKYALAAFQLILIAAAMVVFLSLIHISEPTRPY